MAQVVCERQEECGGKFGRPSTSISDANIEKVWHCVYNDHHLTICFIANKLLMDKKMVQTILEDALDMWKVCAEVLSYPRSE